MSKIKRHTSRCRELICESVNLYASIDREENVSDFRAEGD